MLWRRRGVAHEAECIEVWKGGEVNEGTIELLGISGSLRSGSYNSALLRAARALAPDGVRIEIYDGLGDVPLYNDDDRLLGEPAGVTRIKQAIAAADGVLICTPEYNNSIPGVLQNALDWISRPPADSPLRGKPVGIAGVATGNFGATRAQTVLRQVLTSMAAAAMVRPELAVFQARSRFDDDGNLTDETTRELLVNYLGSLAAWVRRMR